MKRHPQADEKEKASVGVQLERLTAANDNDEHGIGSLPGVRLFSDVQIERIDWLWKHWLACGTVSFLEGDPGLGKSTVVVDVAARITRGDNMPDGSPGLGVPNNVLFVLAEDTASTVRSRLEAAGADTARCVLLDYVLDVDGKPRTISIPDDLPRIEQVIRTHNVRLAILDPWFAFMAEGIDTHNDAGSRRALTPTTKTAEATGCTVLALRHWNRGKGKAIARGMGSTAFGAAARSVITVGVDPADDTRCVMAVVKTNLGPMPTSLGFSTAGTTSRPDSTTIRDSTGAAVETSRIDWHGANTAKANDLVAGEDVDSEGATALDEACDFLAAELSKGGQTKRAIDAAARDAGVAQRTLKRAKKKLGVRSAKQHFSGEWLWELPATAGQEDQGCP